VTPNEIKLHELLRSNHVEDYMNDVRDVSVDAIFIEPTGEVKDESVFKLGETKMYGQPHFPSRLPWPKGVDSEKVPYYLSFLAQINLENIIEHMPGMPESFKKGILYFFISPSFDELTKSENDSVSKDVYKVVFYNGPSDRLAPLAYPKPSEDIIDTDLDYNVFCNSAQKVSIRKDLSLPSFDRLPPGYIPVEVSKDWHDYQFCCFNPFRSKGIQLFGFTVPVQSSPAQDIDEYILLLSCVGPWDKTFYFYIPKADLKQGIFTNIELVMQYT